MLIYEMKLEGINDQYRQLDRAIRTGRFIRNSIIKAWMDGEIKSRNDAYAYCKVLADKPEFPWASQLNSMARQAHAERAWASIERFYRNCKAKTAGKKGYPKFAREQVRASVEYKTSGYKLSEDRRYLTFTDGFKAGTFKLWGSRDLHFYQLNQIKRIRVVRRHDGYYAQFLIDHTREENKELTGNLVGLDVGLNHFYTDSAGNKVDNPRFLRKDERKLKKLQRRLSRAKKGSKNRAKARNRLGRAHLSVSRRRNDWVCKLARRVIQSNDLVAVESLKVRNMVKNHHLAKAINDAAWYRFREWLEYFGKVYGVPVIAVEPKLTSQNCSNCGEKVVKTLSTRTHQCPHCKYVADRDENAAKNILKLALKQWANTVGQTEINASGENDPCLDGETQPSKSTRRKRKTKERSLESPYLQVGEDVKSPPSLLLPGFMNCIINRRAQFSASHRYWLPELSEAENIERFGACTRAPGHGHNYVLYVYMAGELDEYGMVLNLSDVKHVIKGEVTSQLDFSYLNEVWPEFKQTLPTTENIARVIWQRLAPHLPLVRIQLFEHPELWADYIGNGMEAYLSIATHFSAAHRLARPDLSYEKNCEIYGKCARPNGHGHNYHLEVTVKGEIDPRTGMTVDLGELQKVVDNYVVEPFDHTFLNKDIAYFAEVVPTAENIAIHIRDLLQEPIRQLGAALHKVKLMESPNNSCEVYATEPVSGVVNAQMSEPVLVKL